MDKYELQALIESEIRHFKEQIDKFSSSVESDAINRVAISNLYIALSNLLTNTK